MEKEAGNDGQSVFLHYNSMLGMYMTFGHSAYYADMVASPELSFSDELQMPVALLTKSDVLDLRQSMAIVDHSPRSFYWLQTRQRIGDAGYERWIKNSKIECVQAVAVGGGK